MRRIVFALALTVLAACQASVGGNGPDAHRPPSGDGGTIEDIDGAHSGERLKIVWYEFNDGTKVFDGTLYDVVRKENCFVSEGWSDGKAYCAPAKASANVVFTDAACSHKAAQVFVDEGCPAPPPPSILDFDTTACTQQPARAYTRGSKIDGLPDSGYYLQFDTDCIGPFDPLADDFYELGPQITNLAEVTVEEPAGNGRFTERFYTTPDGFRFPARLHDATLDVDCEVPYLGPDTTMAPCNPSGAGTYDYRKDNQCENPVIAMIAGCPAPAVAVSFDNACPLDPGTYTPVGARTTGNNLFTGDANSCSQTSVSGADLYASSGAAMAVGMLPRVHDSTGHRVELVHLAPSDDLHFRDIALYDTLTQTDCAPTTLPDGSKFCFPATYTITSDYFSDDNCNDPIDVVEVFTGDVGVCGPPPAATYAQKAIAAQAGSCTPKFEIHPMGAVREAPVYDNFSGDCKKYVPTDTQIYDIGDVVPVSTFAAAATVTDN